MIASLPDTMKLDFVCVGPQRTATSWLHKHLSPHPQLALPQQVKETMFFDERFENGMPWYWQHFAVAQENQKLGEIGPTYFDSESALRRLAAFAGLKIIINIRDPVERTYSVFRHHRSKGRVPDDYFAAVKLMPRIESSGRYAVHCPRWEEAFGKHHCHYIFQARVEQAPQSCVDTLCDFLAVDRIVLPPEAAERFGQATRPRWPLAAKLAARLSVMLRSRGLHGPVEAAKRIGLRPLVFGNPAGAEQMPEDVRRHLQQHHAEDLEYLQARFGEPLAG